MAFNALPVHIRGNHVAGFLFGRRKAVEQSVEYGEDEIIELWEVAAS